MIKKGGGAVVTVLWTRNDYKQYIKTRRRVLVDVTCVVEDVVVLVINRIKIQNKTSTYY